MNKTLLKNFAIDARIRLLQMVQDRAALVGITKNKIESPVSKSADYEIYQTPAGTENTITGREIKQRENLAKKIKAFGFDNVMEQAAYTWFNRIIAIRYMEVNGYLPSRVRVLSSATFGKKEPDIVTEAPNGVYLNFTDAEKQKIAEFKSKPNKTDELFAFLFIKQCNELNKILPKLFESTNMDFTELLFGLSYTRTDGLLARLLEIDEEDFKDQVQIIGWMYQYYNTELKDDTFAKLKKNIKITKERIPAATQLFTPDWIVRYMVENSLGRLALNGQNVLISGQSKRDMETQFAQRMGWKYYLPQAEQTEEVQKKLDDIRQAQWDGGFNLESVKILDPCMGSGHILVYAFDVLVTLYQNAGYNERDAARLILENNIFGIDIDDRAAQLSYFALMMKGRQYDRRFFDRGVCPKVYAVAESNQTENGKLIIESCGLDKQTAETLLYVLDLFADAKEYGSILDVSKRDYDSVMESLNEWKKNKENTLETSAIESCIDNELMPLLQQAKVMSRKYDVVVINPPYMGASGMGEKLGNFVKQNYEDSKSDLFAVFIEKCCKYAKQGGLVAMITQHSWMFLSSFEILRGKISQKANVNMAHLGARAFDEIGGEVVQTTAFVQLNEKIENYKGTYVRLVDFVGEENKEKEFLSGNNRFFTQQENFSKIPGMPVAYWVSEKFRNIFENKKLFDYGETKQGFATGNNNKFLRFWHEVSNITLLNHSTSVEESSNSKLKWFPCNKGGAYNKWYGNNLIIANWQNNGKEMSGFKGSVIRNPTYYFKEGLTWSSLAARLSMRYSPFGFLFESKGSMCFLKNPKNIKIILGLLNSKTTTLILSVLSPTLDFHEGPMSKIPIIFPTDETKLTTINTLVQENINLSKIDWDSFETSWDFAKHPLLPANIDFKNAASNSILISDCYAKWEKECSERFATLKANEEKLNEIFIEIYGLQDELSPEVLDKDVTVRRADLQREIKSLLSFAVGCMFGRYSLYKEGLAYAGGNMDMANYKYFIPDADNVIPVTDEEYFNDDIVTRFAEFIRQLYGESTLEENLKFIAESLGNRGNTPKEIIRSYFLNDFYKDHCKIYQKRPIYWLFDSGKENGFKALIYMHRYDNQTLARVRTDYLHKLQAMYESALFQCKQIIENPVASTHDKKNSIKRQAKITKQLAETRVYDQALGHVASRYIDLDLDDGVNVNYEKFQGVEVAREGQKSLKVDLLGKRG